MNPIVKKYAVKHGLIVGVIAALYTLIAYVADPTLFVNWWLGIGLLLVNFVILVMAPVNAKKAQDGLISFKDSFSTFVIAAAIATGISTVINMLIFGVVDPEFKDQLTEMTIETTVEMLEGFGTPEEAIEESIAEIEAQDQFAVSSLFFGFFKAMVFYAIIGLIIAAITKKVEPIVDTGEIIDSED